MNYYQAAFADGQIEARQSTRIYTHCVRHMWTRGDRLTRYEIAWCGRPDLADKSTIGYTPTDATDMRKEIVAVTLINHAAYLAHKAARPGRSIGTRAAEPQP